MKKNTLFLLFISFIFIFIFSCKKDTTSNINMGYNYMPSDVGRYVIYDVDSVDYKALDSSISYKFQIKEKIESIYNDNQNRPTIRLERYIKYYNDTIPYSAMTWTLRDVWAENITNTTAEKVEENIRYIKLAFPVKENQTWDGNSQNTLGNQTYSYDFFDSPRTIASIAFDSVLQVNQLNTENLINKYYEEEKYARSIGMIYKKYMHIESQCPSCVFPADYQAFYAPPFLERITFGTSYTMTVNSFGVE